MSLDREILATCMMRPVCWELVGQLPADQFHPPWLAVFKAMGAAVEAGVEPGNIIQVLTYSPDDATTKAIYEASDHSGYIPTSAEMPGHLRKLRQRWQGEQLSQLGGQVNTSLRAGTSPDQVIVDTEQLLEGLEASQDEDLVVPAAHALRDTMQHIEALQDHQGQLVGIGSGFHDLDRMTCGWQPGDLIVVAGRPSMGKTAFALGCADRAAVQLGLKTLIISLEMGRLSLMLRMVASRAWVDHQSIREGRLSQQDWKDLAHAMGDIGQSGLKICDRSALQISQIRQMARRQQRRDGLDMLVIDYLQLMSGKGHNREREIAEISRSLKVLARELKIPVMALSQLNRGLESRSDKRPMLSDLRESGAIEQDADTVIMLYRPSVYDDEVSDSVAEAIVVKQRNGPVGSVELRWDGRHTRFDNLEVRHGQ